LQLDEVLQAEQVRGTVAHLLLLHTICVIYGSYIIAGKFRLYCSTHRRFLAATTTTTTTSTTTTTTTTLVVVVW